MATLRIHIPDTEYQRVLDVICIYGHWSPAMGMTQLEFVETNVARIFAERVHSVEMLNIQAAAMAAIVDPGVIPMSKGVDDDPPPPPATVPAAPSLDSIVIGDTEIRVLWVAPTDDGGSPVIGYVVTLNDGTGVVNYPAQADDVALTIRGLSNDVTYTVVVTATNSVGNSAPSPSATAVPLAGADPIEE